MASTSTTATTSHFLLAVILAAAGSGSSCAPVQPTISERDQIPGCGWYVARRVCNSLVGMYPPEIFREMCCQQLEAIPTACRCKALRAMLEAPPISFGGGHETEAWSGHDLVAKAECGLPAVHGWPICSSSD